MSPHLPPELWQRIFRFACLSRQSPTDDDGNHVTSQLQWPQLWLQARQVNHAWRANIAQTYLEVFLRCSPQQQQQQQQQKQKQKQQQQTRIRFHCEWDESEWDYMFHTATVEMGFDRLDANDESRVVFKEVDRSPRAGLILGSGRRRMSWEDEGENGDGDEDKESDRVKRLDEKIYETWSRNIDDYIGVAEEDEWRSTTTGDSGVDGGYGGEPSMTPHVITIHGASLDSELPGLQYDVSKREISFEWEPMLHAFCIEYAELEKRDLSREKEILAGVDDMISSYYSSARGMSAIIDVMDSWWAMKRKNLQALRRHRIRRQWKEKLGFDPQGNLFDIDHEEKQLKRIRDADGTGREDYEDESSDEDDMVGADFGEEFLPDFDDDSDEEDSDEDDIMGSDFEVELPSDFDDDSDEEGSDDEDV